MNTIDDLNKKIETISNGLPEYHYACEEWCKLMAEESKDLEEKEAYKIRGAFHKLIGDNLKC